MPDAPSPLGFPLHLHHVGFVVANIERSAEGFMNSLGMHWDGTIYEDPIQKVKVTFLATEPTCAQIELIEPAADDSPVNRFLAKGGGQHHLCYEVGDIEGALAVLKSRKASIVQQPCPAIAFDGRRIAWLITREKLVVELLENVR
jgi:methylmalonyl-CoA/ethylmalonyl-CoA epimerase